MTENAEQLDELIEDVWNAGRVGSVEISGAEAQQLTDEITRLRGTIGAVRRCVGDWARGKDARAVCAHIDGIVNSPPAVKLAEQGNSEM
jgi:hypothetical protein